MSTTSAPVTPGVFDKERARRAVVAASLGNALEWFDIIVYAFMAPVIQRLFFPRLDDTIGLVITYGLFGVSYLIRPLGAIVIGHYGDRHGRKAALTLTIGLMTAGVALMAFAPTYATWGVAAPLLIVVSRLVQGFSAGGEFGSATAFMTENSEQRKAFYASWQVATQGAAMFLAATAGFLLNTRVAPETLDAWAWRLPFLFGLLIGPIGLWIRMSMDDTPEFADAAKVDSPIGATFRHHMPRVLTAAGCVGVATMSVYLITYMPTFAQKNLGLPPWSGYAGAIVAGLIALVGSPLAGALADRIGQTRIMLAAAVIGLVVAWPMFAALTTTPAVWTLIAIEMVLGALMAAYFAPLPSLLAELFPVEVRTTGMSLAYNIGVTLLGGFAPSILAWLVTHSLQAPSFYYMGVAILSIVSLLVARRVYGAR
ncbi:MFS transporter [Mobilicoccus pelagius]|uniref:Putative proline/betaine transporter n=1 Tax=Mobilicoccus pelagius NBRC 104925 TaxID=1089455 RepID=H5UUQ0_9MICO|nr:MFS transporter [Mobilicoccus pelagius]GAB49458.1 putative major facilitator superfamily transporter [Mobilicoccus pelagius NBRC 104925]